MVTQADPASRPVRLVGPGSICDPEHQVGNTNSFREYDSTHRKNADSFKNTTRRIGFCGPAREGGAHVWTQSGDIKWGCKVVVQSGDAKSPPSLHRKKKKTASDFFSQQSRKYCLLLPVNLYRT